MGVNHFAAASGNCFEKSKKIPANESRFAGTGLGYNYEELGIRFGFLV